MTRSILLLLLFNSDHVLNLQRFTERFPYQLCQANFSLFCSTNFTFTAKFTFQDFQFHVSLISTKIDFFALSDSRFCTAYFNFMSWNFCIVYESLCNLGNLNLITLSYCQFNIFVLQMVPFFIVNFIVNSTFVPR